MNGRRLVARRADAGRRAGSPRAAREFDLAEFAGQDAALRIEIVAPADGAPEGGEAIIGVPQVVTARPIERARREPGAPDLFVILVDTLRADALGCYGAARPTSPNLDALARESLVYETAYSQCAWTLPSTATLFTGLHPDDHGVRGYDSTWLHDQHETLAEALAARGITCGAIVANPLVSEASNFAQGFETLRNLEWSNARKVVRHALQWLDEHEDDRVFAYLHFVDPHSPYDAPVAASDGFDVPGDPYAGRSFEELMRELGSVAEGGGPDDAAWNAEVGRAMARARALYDTEVRYFDRWLGVLLEELRARGRLDHAVLLVTADHGEEFLEHGGFFHGPHLFEESVRVPFVLRAPGLTPGRVATPIDGMRVKPLLLDLMGLGGSGTPDERALAHFPDAIHLATEVAREGERFQLRRDALVQLPWKLIATPELDHEELFDLARDRGERDDRLGDEPRVGAALRERLRRWREEHAGAASIRWLPDPPALLDRLRAIGYVR